MCLATGRLPIADGGENRRPTRKTTSLHDSLLADRTSSKVRSDNAVQFSKTTALLGAAGKISITSGPASTAESAPWEYFSSLFPGPENPVLPQKNKPPRFARAAPRTAAMLFAYPRALTRSLVLSRRSCFIVEEVV